MKLNIAEIVLLASLICDLVSSKLTVTYESATKQEHQALIVLCSSTQTGEPVSWSGPKNNKLGVVTNPPVLISTHGAQLIFADIRKEQAGTYTCSSRSETVKFILYVEDKPRLPPDTIEKHFMREEIIYGYIGGIVNLTCEVEAEPPPTFTWAIKHNRRMFGQVVKGAHSCQSILMLRMTWDSIGEYKCQARNEHGQFDIRFLLLNGTQPRKPSYLKLLEATPDSLVFKIDGPEPDEEDIEKSMAPLGYRVEYRPVVEWGNETWMGESFLKVEAKTYSLTQLAPKTQYEVRAATENLAGLSEFTNLTCFETDAASRPNSTITFVASFTLCILSILFNNGLFNSHH